MGTIVVVAERPLVLNGDRGLSQKGATPGNASMYYSAPRLRTSGTVRLPGREIAVRGTSWLDREWSTSALEADQVGWDWFALHLSDGRDLMLYVLRDRERGVSPQSAGTLIEPDGTARPLRREDFRIRALETWSSPRGSEYPARWAIEVPAHGLALEVQPSIADQELDLAFRYWEGAVRGTGTSRDATVSTRGFVELTGY